MAAKTSFQVACPFCNDDDATVKLDLNDLRACECTGCGETFSPKQARDKAAEMARRWAAVVAWVEMATASV